MGEIKITINGKEAAADASKSILHACLDAGVYVPHLCSHPDLEPIGACGLCVVEVEGREGLVSSCVTPAEDGMVIRTSGGSVDAARREALERKLAGHPADCDSCVKYLNCELQSLKQYLIGDHLQIERRLRMFGENAANPLFLHNPTKCVQCGRCVRACHKPPFPHNEAVDIIEENTGKQFDPMLVEAFMEVTDKMAELENSIIAL
jgi:NADH dehydrogenase/NADH:ubiquinone oxidoreductase subunit G